MRRSSAPPRPRSACCRKDVLHVGDDAALDVVGALDAGMQAAWLVRDERPWEHGARPQLIVPNLHALCVALDAA